MTDGQEDELQYELRFLRYFYDMKTFECTPMEMSVIKENYIKLRGVIPIGYLQNTPNGNPHNQGEMK